MKAILAAVFAFMIGLVFAGSTFAVTSKPAAPAATQVAGGPMKKDEGKKAEKKHARKTHAAKKQEKK